MSSAIRTATKPAYHLMPLAEIALVKPIERTVVELFAGCGGSSLGYRQAGYTVRWANEFIPLAAECYRLNHPHTIVDERDVRALRAPDILDAIGMLPGELDLLDGSPPCSAFSTVGVRHAAWGQVKGYSTTDQRVDDLFFEFVRLLGLLRPKVFVAENVSGLVKGVSKGYFLNILAAMKDAGYTVSARLLDAQFLGVPQARQRIIFVGVRTDLGVEPRHPTPLPYSYTLQDALPHVERLVQFEVYDEGQRVHINRPAPTITVMGLGAKRIDKHYVVANGEQRKLTIDELKLLSGFPADFQLRGTFAEQWERIARAVPPPMMYQIAATLRDFVFRKIGRP